MKILDVEINRVDSLNIAVTYKGIITYHGTIESAFRKVRTYKRNEALGKTSEINQLLGELKKIDESFAVAIQKLNNALVEENMKL